MMRADAFSHLIPVETIAPEGRRAEIEADEAARAAIAERLSVPEIKSLKGAFVLRRTSEGIDLDGAVEAHVVRECVASLELFDEAVAEPFSLRFAFAKSGADLDDENAPEPLDGDALDLGEILVQQLSLAMSPYPRKPGAKSLADVYGGAETASPFAGLADAIAKWDRKE